MACLSSRTTNTLAELSPEWMPLGNPLDIWPAVMRHGLKRVYAAALEAVLDDHNVDGVLCISIAPYLPDFDFLDVSESLNNVVLKERQKPVVAWLYGPNVNEISKRFEKEKKITVYQTVERSAWSLALLRERRQLLEKAIG
jgi:acetyltransferase